MNKSIKAIKKLFIEGNLQKAVYEICSFVEDTQKEEFKAIYYNNFADGGTIKDMIQDYKLLLIESRDIKEIDDIENREEYEIFMNDEIIIVNKLNETTVYKAINQIEKLLK